MFVWDESKRLKVIDEHKVDFALLVDVFDDAFAVYLRILRIRPMKKHVLISLAFRFNTGLFTSPLPTRTMTFV